MTFAEDQDVMRFLAEQVAEGKMVHMAFAEAASNDPRARQLKQLIADAIGWGRDHAGQTEASVEDAPPAFASRIDGLEF